MAQSPAARTRQFPAGARQRMAGRSLESLASPIIVDSFHDPLVPDGWLWQLVTARTHVLIVARGVVWSQYDTLDAALDAFVADLYAAAGVPLPLHIAERIGG